MASTKKQTKKKGFFATSDVSLFDVSQAAFTETRKKKRVRVHLVPAPWSRVIILSMVYALGVTFVKILWFNIVGRPQLYAVTQESAVSADYERLDREKTESAVRELREAAEVVEASVEQR